MVTISPAEIPGLYLSLKGAADMLDPRLAPLLARLERYLFERLSIEEIEAMEAGYPENVEVLLKKL